MSAFNAGLQGILGGLDYVQQGIDRGTERKKANTLASLAGEYYSGNQSPEMLGKYAAAGGNSNPLAQYGDGQKDQQMKKAAFYAGVLLRTPKEQRAQVWDTQVAPGLSAAGLPVDGPYREEYEGIAMQLAGGEANKPMNVAPGGQIIDPVTGRVIASNENFAPQKPVWDSDRGAWVIPPGGQYPQPQQAPPQAPQPTMQDAGGPESFGPMTVGQAMSKIQQIEANRGSPFAPPERLRMIQQMTTTGQFNTDPQASQGGGGSGPGFVQVLPPKAKERATPSGYEWSGDRLVPIGGGPADPSVKPVKPMPAATRRLLLDERDLAMTADNVNTNIGKWLGWLDGGKLPLGVASNAISSGKNFAGASDEGSRNYGSFRAGLEGMRNASLRLNKGVQTEGDAVRAWNELLASINDPALVKQRLEEIQMLNERAKLLHQQNVEEIESDFGGGSKPQAPAGGNVIKYDAQGNRIK